MHGTGSGSSDPRRPDKEHRYKPPPPTAQAAPGEDLTPDYMNILGMIFSMCGLMMRHLNEVKVIMPAKSVQGPTPKSCSAVALTGLRENSGENLNQLKWCAWVALYCSFISFANSRANDDTKQILSSFMLSISAVVMSYLQNPQPMNPPWSAIFV